MRVVLFTTDYLPNVGGVATHVLELAQALCAAGHGAAVLTNVLDPAGSASEDACPPVVRVRERLRWSPIRRARRLQFALNLLPYTLGLLRKCDLVHFHTVDPLAGMLSAMCSYYPMIATNHTSMFVEEAGDAHKATPWRRFLRRMDGVIAPSEELARLTETVTGNALPVRYLPNGVDARRFHPDVCGAGLRKRYGVRPDERLIVCPRRLVSKNGCVHLARALRSILRLQPQVRLLFAGDGPERIRIQAELDAADCLDTTIFAGNVPNSEMPAIYAAADVVVVPSLIEATSIAVLEAMATARPVVASDVGGIPALIEEGETGCLVRPGDEPGLAAAVCELLEDRSRRERMGEAARRRVLQEFTWDRIAAATLDVYREFLILGDRRRAATKENCRA